MHALKRVLAWIGLIEGDTPPPTESQLAESFKAFFERTYGTRVPGSGGGSGAALSQATTASGSARGGGSGGDSSSRAGGSDGDAAATTTEPPTRAVTGCPDFEPLSYLSALDKAKAQMKCLFVFVKSPVAT
jgi:hypothetical protein